MDLLVAGFTAIDSWHREWIWFALVAAALACTTSIKLFKPIRHVKVVVVHIRRK